MKTILMVFRRLSLMVIISLTMIYLTSCINTEFDRDINAAEQLLMASELIDVTFESETNATPVVQNLLVHDIHQAVNTEYKMSLEPFFLYVSSEPNYLIFEKGDKYYQSYLEKETEQSSYNMSMVVSESDLSSLGLMIIRPEEPSLLNLGNVNRLEEGIYETSMTYKHLIEQEAFDLIENSSDLEDISENLLNATVTLAFNLNDGIQIDMSMSYEDALKYNNPYGGISTANYSIDMFISIMMRPSEEQMNFDFETSFLFMGGYGFEEAMPINIEEELMIPGIRLDSLDKLEHVYYKIYLEEGHYALDINGYASCYFYNDNEDRVMLNVIPSYQSPITIGNSNPYSALYVPTSAYYYFSIRPMYSNINTDNRNYYFSFNPLSYDDYASDEMISLPFGEDYQYVLEGKYDMICIEYTNIIEYSTITINGLEEGMKITVTDGVNHMNFLVDDEPLSFMASTNQANIYIMNKDDERREGSFYITMKEQQ